MDVSTTPALLDVPLPLTFFNLIMITSREEYRLWSSWWHDVQTENWT